MNKEMNIDDIDIQLKKLEKFLDTHANVTEVVHAILDLQLKRRMLFELQCISRELRSINTTMNRRR